MGNIEFKNGTFKGEEELKYLTVCKRWEPNLLQRFLYWTGLKKDPRINGDYVKYFLDDELGMTVRSDVSARYHNTTIKVNELTGVWIKVKDRLPEEDGVYLYYESDIDTTYQAYYCKQSNIFEFEMGAITPTSEDYWMPLPKPPKE